LQTPNGREYLLRQYGEYKKAAYAIAQELGVGEAMIRRCLSHHRIAIRKRGKKR
jgi:hypothetical protein